jgi:hypothetical protein
MLDIKSLMNSTLCTDTQPEGHIEPANGFSSQTSEPVLETSIAPQGLCKGHSLLVIIVARDRQFATCHNPYRTVIDVGLASCTVRDKS